jgi:hypothetical protein
VILTLTAVDGFLRAIQKYMVIAAQSQSEPAQSEPVAVEESSPQSQPGVVMLKPINVPDAPAPAPAPAEAPTNPRP